MTAVLSTALATSCAQPSTVDLAIRDVHVVDVTSGALRRNQDVLISGGRIESIQPTGSRPYRTSVSVDGTGRFLAPGLIDMHVHLRHAGVLTLYLAHGVTTVRNMNGSFGQAQRWAEEVSVGSRIGPRIVNASPTIRQDRDSSYEARADTPEQAEALVERFAREGWDWIKVYQAPEPATDALGRTAARLGIPIAGHIPWFAPEDADLDASRGGVLRAIAPLQTVEHMGGFLYGWFRDSADVGGLPAFAGAVAGSGVGAVTPTLGQDYVLARIVSRGPAALSPEERALVERFTGPEGVGVLDATIAAMHGTDPWLPDFQRRMAVALREAGVTLLLGTDSHSPFALAGRSLQDEARLWEEGGIDPVSILRAGTVDAARVLGLDRDIGRVAPGFLADLVLLDGDPRTGTDALRKIAGIVRAGRWFDRAATERWLEQAAATPPYCSAPRCR